MRCAVVVQQGMADRNANRPELERIRFRIGINLGDVIHDKGDIFGDGVHVAARLQTLAELVKLGRLDEAKVEAARVLALQPGFSIAEFWTVNDTVHRNRRTDDRSAASRGPAGIETGGTDLFLLVPEIVGRA